MITIQNQNFGVEIELTGITRQAAAQVIADYYGTIGTRFMGTVYKTYEAVDNKGRRWKCMRDASITPQRRVNGHVVDANDEYKCEVVTPILQYEDIPDLQLYFLYVCSLLGWSDWGRNTLNQSCLFSSAFLLR